MVFWAESMSEYEQWDHDWWCDYDPYFAPTALECKCIDNQEESGTSHWLSYPMWNVVEQELFTFDVVGRVGRAGLQRGKIYPSHCDSQNERNQVLEN